LNSSQNSGNHLLKFTIKDITKDTDEKVLRVRYEEGVLRFHALPVSPIFWEIPNVLPSEKSLNFFSDCYRDFIAEA
jgi:hypothetical protein